MTSIGPPLAFMIIIGGTRWLPEPETFGSKSGRVCLPGDRGWPPVAIPSVGVQWWATPAEELS